MSIIHLFVQFLFFLPNNQAVIMTTSTIVIVTILILFCCCRISHSDLFDPINKKKFCAKSFCSGDWPNWSKCCGNYVDFEILSIPVSKIGNLNDDCDRPNFELEPRYFKTRCPEAMERICPMNPHDDVVLHACIKPETTERQHTTTDNSMKSSPDVSIDTLSPSTDIPDTTSGYVPTSITMEPDSSTTTKQQPSKKETTTTPETTTKPQTTTTTTAPTTTQTTTKALTTTSKSTTTTKKTTTEPLKTTTTTTKKATTPKETTTSKESTPKATTTTKEITTTRKASKTTSKETTTVKETTTAKETTTRKVTPTLKVTTTRKATQEKARIQAVNSTNTSMNSTSITSATENTTTSSSTPNTLSTTTTTIMPTQTQSTLTTSNSSDLSAGSAAASHSDTILMIVVVSGVVLLFAVMIMVGFIFFLRRVKAERWPGANAAQNNSALNRIVIEKGSKDTKLEVQPSSESTSVNVDLDAKSPAESKKSISDDLRPWNQKKKSPSPSSRPESTQKDLSQSESSMSWLNNEGQLNLLIDPQNANDIANLNTAMMSSNPQTAIQNKTPNSNIKTAQNTTTQKRSALPSSTTATVDPKNEESSRSVITMKKLPNKASSEANLKSVTVIEDYNDTT